MVLVVQLLEAFARDMGVHLRGRDVGVPEQQLQRTSWLLLGVSLALLALAGAMLLARLGS